MSLLIAGLAIWCIVHLSKSVAPGVRAGLIAKIGENPYKGLFTLAMVAAVTLIVMGWKSTVPHPVYTPPAGGAHATSLLVLVAFVLFGAAHGPSNIKRFIRHPQLTAMICWGIGHLFANGDIRSVLLFGTLTLWAIVEIVMINRRDKTWIKPEPRSSLREIPVILIGGVVFIVFVFAHSFLFGVSPIAR